MDKPIFPIDDLHRWQIYIMRLPLGIPKDNLEQSLQLFNNLEWASRCYDAQEHEMKTDPALGAWCIVLSDHQTGEPIFTNGSGTELLLG